MYKHLNILLIIALLTCVSCLNEEDLFITEREPAAGEQVFGSSLTDGDLLTKMNIYVSDDLASSLEESTKPNGEVNLRPFKSLTRQGVVSMRRLFPDAGKFEARTREEGLHKWYVLSYEEAHPMTKAPGRRQARLPAGKSAVHPGGN